MSKSNDWTLIRACLLLLVSAPVLCVGTVIFAGTGSSWELWQQTAFGLLIPFLGCLFSIQTNIGRKLILRYAEFRHGSQDCGAIKTAIHADTYGFCDALTTTWKHPLRSRLALFLKALRFFIILAALPLIGQWIIANPDMSFSNEHVIASYSYLYDVLVNLPELNRFELYAVMDTFLLAILTHLTIEEPTKNSIKFLGIILILIAGALATALLFLFKKSVFWGSHGSRHRCGIGGHVSVDI